MAAHAGAPAAGARPGLARHRDPGRSNTGAAARDGAAARPPPTDRRRTVGPAARRRRGAQTLRDLPERPGRCRGGADRPGDPKATSEAAERHAWDAAFAPVHDTAPAELREWVDGLRGSGLVRRLAGNVDAAGPLLADLAAVLATLPATGEALGAFAARITGRAHALDDDQPLATLALGAARVLSGLPNGSGAAWRREVWASVGLLRDELSTTVLTLGLPGDTETATGRALGALREVGQPVALTLRQLVRDPPRLAVGRVAISENPVVLAAAAQQLGRDCAPLVCTSGQPGAAVMQLLRGLAADGTVLRHHGDFDWGGLRIGNLLHARLPVQPWRYDAAAYRNAVRRGVGRPLTGQRLTASWDSELSATMHATGRAVEEELLLDELLADLAVG